MLQSFNLQSTNKLLQNQTVQLTVKISHEVSNPLTATRLGEFSLMQTVELFRVYSNLSKTEQADFL